MVLFYSFFVHFSQALSNCNAANKETPDCGKSTFLPQIGANQQTLQTLLGFVFGALGFTAVVVIIIAGIRYITSQGNPEQHKQAWKTILYACIGLAVVLLADAIVSLTLRKV